MKRIVRKTKAYFLFMLVMAICLQNMNISIFAEENGKEREPAEYDKRSDSYETMCLSAPEYDGRYYLTECEKPAEKNDVNLEGTGYDHALFNPKNNAAGATVPWYISLGGEEAMCVTFNGHASVSDRTHHYVLSDINILKSNPYFQGGEEYPVEDYLKGVCYAYETLTHPEEYVTKEYLDSGRAELIRKTNPSMVWYSGKSVNYAVHQIITWRIASGSFNPENLEYEHNLARVVFGQMYPGSEWKDYESKVVDFYDYYAQCAKEAAGGSYGEKYSTTKIKYWTIQNMDEYTDLSGWQDFITWEVPKLPLIPGAKIIDVYKYGTDICMLIPEASYGVYSDSACTNKIGTYTTDKTGNFKIYAIEGIYYLKELSAPDGTVQDTQVYTLNIEDNTISVSVKNAEIRNYLELYKYEEGTGNIITEEAKFDLYEYNSGIGSYLRMGELVYNGNGKYSIMPSQGYSYHSLNGMVMNTVYSDCLYYTPVNQGRFKVVEVSSPKGWKKADDKEFMMNTSADGYVQSFNSYDTGMVEQPYYCGVSLYKYDSFTGVKLSGAKFKIQEKVADKWYDVGELKEIIKKSESGSSYSVYQTADTQVYSFHDTSGKIYRRVDNCEYPLHRTVSNQGIYRLVETKASNDYYVGEWTKEFEIAPETDNTTVKFWDFGNTASENRGNGNKVITRKYDAVTREIVASPAEITVYEHIEALDKWLKVGVLNYDADSQQYTTDGIIYRPHQADGSISTEVSDKNCLPGYLYYTSENKGRYKLVETVSPVNYEKGILIPHSLQVKVYEKEFVISKHDGEILDFTNFSDGVKDMGLSANIELVKYDAITKQKVKNGDAEFTVYEKIGGEWLEAGRLIYDEANEYYTSKGMKLNLHDSKGNPVYTEDMAQGFYYTTANQGKYRVVETKAPKDYLKGDCVFIKDFDVVTDSNNKVIQFDTIEKGAVNIGISGTVKTAKYDNVTKEKVRTGDAVFTVYEYIETMDKWQEVGVLGYREEEQEYVSDGQDFIFHDAEGRELDTSGMEGFEKGRLYRTSVNLGRFKVKETKAPSKYTPGDFEKIFVITEEGNDYEFNTLETGAGNTGISGKVKLVKKDRITKKPLSGAVFVLQEWSVLENDWLNAGFLKDNLDGTYITENCVIHTGSGEETIKSPTLIYTTQNLGRFRVMEAKAPEGYINEKSICGEICLSDENTEFIFDNERKVENTPIRVSISKKSVTSKKDIAGARLTVKDYGGNIVDTWISDGTKHIISPIPAGRYILEEEQAPDGYVLTGRVEFEVKETNEIQQVEMFNDKVKGKLVIDKVDKHTGEPLAGAQFVLRDEEGNTILTLITDEKGHAESELIDFGIYDTDGKYLGSKKYTLTEVKAPEGYMLNRESYNVEFEYKDGRMAVVEVNMTVANDREPEVPTGDKSDLPLFTLMFLAAVFVLCAGHYYKRLSYVLHK